MAAPAPASAPRDDETKANHNNNNAPSAAQLKKLEYIWKARVEREQRKVLEVEERRQQDVTLLINKLKNIQGNLCQDQKRIDQRLEEGQHKIETLEGRVATLKSQNEELSGDNSKLSQDAARATAISERLTSENKVLTERSEKLSRQNEELQEQNCELSERNARLSDTALSLTAESERLTAENGQLIGENEALLVESERLAAEAERLSAECHRLRLARFGKGHVQSSPDSAVGSMDSVCSSLAAGASSEVFPGVSSRRSKGESRSNTDPSRTAIDEMLQSDFAPLHRPQKTNDKRTHSHGGGGESKIVRPTPRTASSTTKATACLPTIEVLQTSEKRGYSYSNPEDPEEVFKKTADTTDEATEADTEADANEVMAPPLPPRRKRSTSSPCTLKATLGASDVITAARLADHNLSEHTPVARLVSTDSRPPMYPEVKRLSIYSSGTDSSCSSPTMTLTHQTAVSHSAVTSAPKANAAASTSPVLGSPPARSQPSPARERKRLARRDSPIQAANSSFELAPVLPPRPTRSSVTSGYAPVTRPHQPVTATSSSSSQHRRPTHSPWLSSDDDFDSADDMLIRDVAKFFGNAQV